MTERQLAMNIDNANVIDNPLNLTSYDYIPYPADSKIYNFASVARLETSFKGQDLLFEILSSEKWKHRGWRLNLYGMGPDEQYLKDLAKYYKIDNKVIFNGHVSDIREVWKNNHILLMPSIAEGKPLALEEAMICGRIAVVSDVAGNEEFVLDGETGYLASSFLPAPFEESLEKAWQEKGAWEEKGKQAHKYILSKLDLSPESTVLEEILKK